MISNRRDSCDHIPWDVEFVQRLWHEFGIEFVGFPTPNTHRDVSRLGRRVWVDHRMYGGYRVVLVTTYDARVFKFHRR